MSKEKESTEKKEYQKPKIDSEEILEAGLMAVCNGTTGGPDALKSTQADGCSSKKS